MKKFQEKKMGSIEEMYNYCKELEVKFFYCQTALDFLNINIENITNSIKNEATSMYAIFNSNKKSQIIFI